MQAKLDYRWNLRQVMATRDMFATPTSSRPLRHGTSTCLRARSTASSSSDRSALA